MNENPPRKLQPEDEFNTETPLEVPSLAANDNDGAERLSTVTTPSIEAANDNDSLSPHEVGTILEAANDNKTAELADSEKREAVLERLHALSVSEDAKEDFRGHGEAIHENAIEGTTGSAERAVAKAEANIVVAIAASPTGGKEGPKLSVVKGGESEGKRKLPTWLKWLGKGLKWTLLSIMGALALIPTGLRVATDKIMEQAGAKGGGTPKKASGGGSHGGGGHH